MIGAAAYMIDHTLKRLNPKRKSPTYRQASNFINKSIEGTLLS